MPRLAACFVVLLMLVSCAAMNYDKMSASELFERAQKYFDEGKYVRAQEAFEAFLQRYPFSSEVATAEIRVADCMFYRGNYEEAKASYEEFRKRHPLHSESPHALLFEAKCYYEQRLSYDRDLRNLKEAQSRLVELSERYPSSPAAREAKEILREVRDQLCRREIYVGKFYLRQKDTYAAAVRFEGAAKRYADVDCYPEALFYAAKAWFALGEDARAKRYLDVLLSRFADTDWAKKAQGLAKDEQR